MTIPKFEDPYKYIQDDGLDEEELPQEQSQDKSEPPLTYTLGKHRVIDSEEGDAGAILKKSKYFPEVNFLRSQYCGKTVGSQLHQDLGAPAGNSK